MATIDELVTVIRFDVDEKGLQKLQSLDGVTAKAGDGAVKMGGGFDQAGKKITGAAKNTDKLADSLKRVAIGAVSALSAGAAMSFALNVGKDAKQTDDFSKALDLNTSEMKLWESAIRSAGLSSQSFRSDLAKIQQERGSVSFDDLLQDADHLKRLVDENGGKLGDAMLQGEAWGYSRDMISFLAKGSQGITAALEESRRKGQQVSDEVTAANAKLEGSYRSLWETIDSVGQKVVGRFAPALTGAADAIGEAIARNQGVFEGWGDSVEATINRVIAGLSNDIESLNRATENLKTVEERNRIASLTPEQADAEREEREQSTRIERLFSGGKTLWNMATDPFNAGKHFREGQERIAAIEKREDVWESNRNPTAGSKETDLFDWFSKMLFGQSRPRESLESSQPQSGILDDLAKQITSEIGRISDSMPDMPKISPDIIPMPEYPKLIGPLAFKLAAHRSKSEGQENAGPVAWSEVPPIYDVPTIEPNILDVGVDFGKNAFALPPPTVPALTVPDIPAPNVPIPDMPIPAMPDWPDLPELSTIKQVPTPDLGGQASGLVDDLIDEIERGFRSAADFTPVFPDVTPEAGKSHRMDAFDMPEISVPSFMMEEPKIVQIPESYLMPNRFAYGQHEDYFGSGDGGNQGGVIIENQNVQIDVNPAPGMNEDRLAAMTAERLREASNFDQFGRSGR